MSTMRKSDVDSFSDLLKVFERLSNQFTSSFDQNKNIVKIENVPSCSKLPEAKTKIADLQRMTKKYEKLKTDYETLLAAYTPLNSAFEKLKSVNENMAVERDGILSRFDRKEIALTQMTELLNKERSDFKKLGSEHLILKTKNRQDSRDLKTAEKILDCEKKRVEFLNKNRKESETDLKELREGCKITSKTIDGLNYELKIRQQTINDQTVQINKLKKDEEHGLSQLHNMTAQLRKSEEMQKKLNECECPNLKSENNEWKKSNDALKSKLAENRLQNLNLMEQTTLTHSTLVMKDKEIDRLRRASTNHKTKAELVQ